ncbi:MAG TPA: hypothetical protein VFO91_11330 [Anaerolineales bacterium]|nr:hypothetical protein [Anaerolineales bacterium]
MVIKVSVYITSIPILIGEGLPLFGPLDKDVKLELLASKASRMDLCRASTGSRRLENRVNVLSNDLVR